jgi:HEAT repeat protein
MAHKNNGEPWKSFAADPRSTDELIRIAIKDWGQEYDPDYWPSAIAILHSRGDLTTLQAAQRLASSPLNVERAVAAWLLGEFGLPHRTMPEECVSTLIQMLTVEADPEVIASICNAFHYHERTPEIVQAVSRFKDHPDEDVRFGVVMGLLWSQQDEAIATLIELTRDTDEDVRNWATFGIGQIFETAEEPQRFDTLAIRQALFDRLDDPHWETGREALDGLTLRRDNRIVDRIVDMLADYDLIMKDQFCEGLRDMIDFYTGSQERLELALSRCEEDNKE